MHFAEVGEVANMVTNAVFIDVLIDLRYAGKLLSEFKSLPDRAGIIAPASDVVDFSHARGLNKGLNKAGHVVGVNVVTHLFALVTEDAVFASFEIAFDEVGKKAVELNATVIGAGEAAASQAASRHIEVAPVFLHHHIGSNLGGAEE